MYLQTYLSTRGHMAIGVLVSSIINVSGVGLGVRVQCLILHYFVHQLIV